MHTPTTTFRRPTATAGRHVLLIVLVLLTALFAAVPAHGEAPGGPATAPGDLTLAPALLVSPDCNPDGFHYKVVYPDAPDGSTYHVQWREAPAGPIVQLAPSNQTTGFVASGEGDFLVRAAIVSQGELIHAYPWKDVTVDCPDIKLPPNERTKVTIDVDPVCEPDAHLTYAIQVVDAPNGDQAHKAQWRELGGAVQSVEGANGTIPSGEGTFEVRGVLYVQGQQGFFASDWTQVTVDCPDEPGDDPSDDPSDEPEPQDTPTLEPEGGPQTGVQGDAPRLATPNFTG